MQDCHLTGTLKDLFRGRVVAMGQQLFFQKLKRLLPYWRPLPLLGANS
jgi:hypothetical protein